MARSDTRGASAASAPRAAVAHRTAPPARIRSLRDMPRAWLLNAVSSLPSDDLGQDYAAAVVAVDVVNHPQGLGLDVGARPLEAVSRNQVDGPARFPGEVERTGEDLVAAPLPLAGGEVVERSVELR